MWGSVAGRRRRDRIPGRMRRTRREDRVAPPSGVPTDGGSGAGAGTDIGRSARLAKARTSGVSNTSRAHAPSPRAGRGLLLLIVLGFVAVLVWLWLGTGTRPRERTLASAAEPLPEASPAEPELIPAAALPAKEAPTATETGELEPFSAAPAGPVPAGKLGSLRGHLTIAGDEPMPREWRLVLRPSTLLPRREHAVGRTLALTGGTADFELRDLPLGGYDVFGEAEGFNGQILGVLLEPGNEHPYVNLRLVPAGMLEGRIFDAQGAPAEGIAVTLFPVDGGPEREAASDANGLYRFEKLIDGAYELMLGKATAPLVTERHAVRFVAPHLTFPDLTLPRLGEIQVRVVDSFEIPLQGVVVRGSGTNGGIIEGVTDFDGRLNTKHLPAGHYRIRLQHPAFEEKYVKRIAVDVVAGQVTKAPVRLGP